MSRTLHIRWNHWADLDWPPELTLNGLRYPRVHPGDERPRPRAVIVRLRVHQMMSNSSIKVYTAKHEASARRVLRDWKHTVLASGDFADADLPALRHRNRARWEAW